MGEACFFRLQGVCVHECPPNGQGLVALIILSILEKFDLNNMSKTDYCMYLWGNQNRYFLRDGILNPELNKLSVDYFLNSNLDQYVYH